MIGGQITIENHATTTSPISDFKNGDHVQIGLRDDAGNTELTNKGAAPLFLVEAHSAFFFLQNCLFGVSLAFSSDPIHHSSRHHTTFEASGSESSGSESDRQ